MQPTASEKATLLLRALDAALSAVPLIMKVYRSSFDTRFKADGSPLTLADKMAHELICAKLQASGLPVISEEQEKPVMKPREKSRVYWLVDPLDGTREFVQRNGEFTVNIALIGNGQPLSGVIAAPALDKAWFGSPGQEVRVMDNISSLPASLRFSAGTDHRKFSCVLPRRALPPQPIMAVSRSHSDPHTLALLKRLRRIYPRLRQWAVGSALKLCLLAEKKATLYARYSPTFEWDTAAGHAILRAAGGELYALDTLMPLEYGKEGLRNPPLLAVARREGSEEFLSEFSSEEGV